MADNSQCHNFLAQPLSRRAMLQQSSVGFGSLALAGLLQEQMHNGVLAAESRRAATAPKSARFPARAPDLQCGWVPTDRPTDGPTEPLSVLIHRPAAPISRDSAKPHVGKNSLGL